MDLVALLATSFSSEERLVGPLAVNNTLRETSNSKTAGKSYLPGNRSHLVKNLCQNGNLHDLGLGMDVEEH